MEEENAVEILQRYRRDRRKLLDFMLAGSLIKKVIMPPGAVTLDDVDLDQVSVDYVINCAKKGGMLELAEAIRDYHDHIGLPYMNSVGTADEFFLATIPESSGSPPKRAPPPIPVLISSSSPMVTNPEWCESPSAPPLMRSESFDSPKAQELTVDDIDDFEDDDDLDEVGNFRISRRTANDAADLVPRLPSFATGITDDDLRETAFEILLACAGASGGLIVPSKEKKKEKSRSRLIKKLGRKSESVSQSQSSSGLVSLLEMMRGQMEISEAMDIRTRQGLLNALAGKVGKRMDSLLVPLELLCCVSRTEFSDKKAYLRWQKRQLNMLAEGLINNPVVGFGESGRKATDLKSLLLRIEESESLPSSAGEVQRAECLKSLREVAISLAERPARGDLTGEVCHWADGYHLNVRLYEKLLLCVFDILNDGKLTEEVEEILELLKSTWRVLGITETIHYTCYAWVLFRQYVITSERGLLRHAIQQLKKIPLKEQRGPQERLHLKTLKCRVDNEEISFLESFLSPIRSWADKQLGDYHLHFAEGSLVMEDTVTVAMITWRLLLEESDRAMHSNSSDREQIESYVLSSIKNTFTRMSLAIDRSDRNNEHHLALLAEETKKLMKKDSTIFMPILSQRHPQAIAFSASLIHKLYGNKLKPFLDGAEHLTEDAVSVFPAADSLEQYLLELMTSVCGEDTSGPYFKKLIPYEVESLSGTLVLRWINSQLGRILSWVERAYKQEHWDPISPQQRYGSSIVEVFRIVEETVDQFFALKVPMRSIELSALFRGIDNAFQVYTNHVMEKLASKDDLVPPVPVLTRYKKETAIKVFVKKELFDSKHLDERRSINIDVPATAMLCVQLNTLHYAVSQLSPTSKSSRRVHKRRERKMWKKPIKLSRFPSFGFSGSDFTLDQIPAIFSGYTAESEDSSSSEMSDDSRTYSKSSDENEELDQERPRSVKRRAKSKSISRISSMKVLRRQSTRTLYGAGQRLKKMRSMKRLTSNSRQILRKKNLDRGDFGLLQPHYLRPTSSSASKNVENNQKNLGAARLKRIASLRYNGLLKATCSSAMKGSSSKRSNDVCTYRYCSLHGRRHSHAADNNAGVPSLKRFVSMRRKFMNRQKSVNRRLVLLKRTLSRKRGPLGGRVVTDQESKEVDDNVDGDSDEEVFEEEVSSSVDGGNDNESIGRSSETVMVDVDDNVDRGMDAMETVASKVQESKTETVGATLWRAICEQTVTGHDHDDGKVDGTTSDGTVGDNEEVCREGSSGELREEDGKKTEYVWNETVTLVKQAFDEILAEITDDDSSDDISMTKDEALEVGLGEEDVGADSSDSSCSDMQPVIERDTHLSVIASTFHMRDEFGHQRGPKKWSYLKRVILLKRFLKSLDRKERRKLSDGKESETIMRLRRELVGERKNAEEWMLDHALRQVISTLAPSQKKKVKHLVKAFESLIPMDGGSRGHDDLVSPAREENETVNSQTQTILRDNKDATDILEVSPAKDLEETNLTCEASSFLSIDMKSDEENETVNSPTIWRDNEDTTDLLEVVPAKDLEETNLTSESSSSLCIGMKSDEALESTADASLCNHLAVEEEVDGLALGSFIEEEEKKGESEKQNLSTWRNLIQKHMVMRDNSEGNRNETEQEHKWSYGTDQMTGIDDANAAAVKSIQLAFETILSEIPDSSSDEESVSESSNSLKEEKEHQGETKRSWNSLRKVILLKRFVKSLEKVQVPNPRKMRNLPVESAFEAENVFLRHRSIMEGTRTEGEEMMLDYALRQAISRLAPIQRKKVDLLVQAFDIVLDGHDTPKQTKNSDTPRNNDETKEGKPRVEEGCEVNKDEQKIKNVFARFQVHQKDLKGEEEVHNTPKESRNLPPIRNFKQRIVVEKGKDSRMWKLIYKHMVTEKEGIDSANAESVASVESEYDDEAGGLQIDARRSGTVTLVREALEKILSEIPDNSSDDQSMDSDITTEQELFERNSQVSEEKSEVSSATFKPKFTEKRVKGWNNVKKVILLKRFVSDLGSLTRLSPKTPRVLPWEPDPETEKIRLRHQEIGGKRNSEEWMLDYALRQAISTLAPSQKRKVSLLAQAFDTISLQDMGSGSTPGSAASSRNISRQSSISSMAAHYENEANAEIIRGKLRNLQEDLKESAKLDGVSKDLEEKQQCSSLWRILCKQMEDNEKNQTLPEETRKEEEEEELKEDTSVDGEKMELYQTEAVELLGEVIDGISLEESQDQNLNNEETRQKSETLQVSKVRIDRWSNLKRAILLRRFVKALENVRKFNPREPRFLPPNPEVEAEKVNLRHQETQNKKNGDEWMVDNALQGVVSKLTPARKLKVQLLVQAFESLSATGN